MTESDRMEVVSLASHETGLLCRMLKRHLAGNDLRDAYETEQLARGIVSRIDVLSEVIGDAIRDEETPVEDLQRRLGTLP